MVITLLVQVYNSTDILRKTIAGIKTDKTVYAFTSNENELSWMGFYHVFAVEFG